MHRSSESIASLAGALAKAQAELTNPEKSLVATIRTYSRGEAEQSFRYAPLSSGLDIVRKTLGLHEIATIQTTAIDQTGGTVNLTTVLAHASGEWVSSDWPVCAVADMATPRRMGAALTYARRYALFTLVGIAGEDDLDAPDLATPTTTQKFEPPQQPNQSGNGRPNGGYSHRDQPAPIRRDAGARLSQTAPILEVEASAEVRDRLLTELSGLDSSEKAALWAHRSLPEKNRLVVADADRVEESFRARLASVTTPDTPLNGVPQPPKNAEAAPTAAALEPNSPEKKRRAKSIDKSTLALAEPRRIRDRDHVRYIAHQPCLVCGRQPSDAHHLRFAQSRALGRKASDEFTVPLCRGHHREVHRRGDEAAWWIELNIDPTVTARSLWLETHPLPTAADGISIEGVAPLGTAGADRRNAKQKGPIDKQGPNDKTNPNIAAG